MLGLDVDNDSAFINETVLRYCRSRELELTRSRAYKKNDQAWIEQKNGAVVRMRGVRHRGGIDREAILASSCADQPYSPERREGPGVEADWSRRARLRRPVSGSETHEICRNVVC